MRPNPEYIAQRAIKAPGTMVWAYQRGDDVPAGAVENWDLVVGDDGDVLPVNGDIIARPADDAPRSDWEAYVIGQGTPTADAHELSLAELRTAYDADLAEQPVTLEPTLSRPADSARKDEWVAFVLASGADEAWANGATKVELMNWDNDKRSDFGPAE